MNISKLFKLALGIIGVLLVLVVVASVVLSSINGARNGYSTHLSVGNSVFAPEVAYDYVESDGGGRTNSQKTSLANYENESYEMNVDDRQIIKTGSFEFVVEDVEESADIIGEIATKHGGLISRRDISESQANKKRGYITLRIPNDSFETVIIDIKDVASKVTRESLNTQDVTEEYSDLQSQLKNKRAVEKQYLETLKKAWSIEDILNVQERLDRTRGEIERLEGRITYVERQISMSTISISLVSESEVAVLGVVWNPFIKMKQAAYNALESIIAFIYFVIKFVFVIPVILMWIVTIGGITYVAWKIVLRIKKRLFKLNN